ncbi:MAG TPA: dihydrolipoyl dehydrogenase [Polyangia bacterium]|nr:dihydrolipoyl dehydrogenase [Polyangia bacterium]
MAEFKLPNLGEGVSKGEIVGVSVKAGDVVAKGQTVAEVETDKAVAEVTASFDGKITAVNVKVGDKVTPGAVLLSYEAGAAAAAAPSPAPAKAEAKAETKSAAPAVAPKAAAPAPAPAPAAAPALADLPRGLRPHVTGERHHGLTPEQAATKHVVVIGAGPGGYAAAFYAADLGFKVTMVNKEKQLGGVCTLRGCIPSKGLLHVAKLVNEAKHAPAWGVTFGEPKIDIAGVRAYKESFVSKLVGGLGQVAAARKVKTIQAKASFKDAHTLTLSPGEEEDGKVSGPKPEQAELAFDYCIIATGSIPAMPGPWKALNDPRIMDSTGALELVDVPKRLLVVGGGYIGLEMACVYAALGSEITVVEFAPGLLMAADRDLVKPLHERLGKQFKAIHVNTKVDKLVPKKDGIEVTLVGEGVEPVQTFDRVLVSVGRRPFAGGLCLEKTKIKVDAKGFIEHDAQCRTAEPNVFVIGDIAGEPMLAHKAHAEAKVAVEVIADQRSVYDVVAMPAVVFTDPELAWVGVTEQEAKERGLDVEVARYPWAANGKAHAISQTNGVSKVIVDKKTQRIVGAGVCGWEAGSMISEYALAIEMGATAEDVSLTVHPHPTLNETMLGAVDVYLGHATDIYRPKRK